MRRSLVGGERYHSSACSAHNPQGGARTFQAQQDGATTKLQRLRGGSGGTCPGASSCTARAGGLARLQGHQELLVVDLQALRGRHGSPRLRIELRVGKLLKQRTGSDASATKHGGRSNAHSPTTYCWSLLVRSSSALPATSSRGVTLRAAGSKFPESMRITPNSGTAT